MARIADLHCDTILEIQGGADFGGGAPEGHLDLPRLRRGGVALQVFACFLPTAIPQERVFQDTLGLLDLLEETCNRYSADLIKVETASEAEAAAAAGKIGVLAAVENGHAIAGRLAHLETLRRRGVRAMTLTHSRHLAWAASSGGEGPGPGGLTAFGREVVAAMNDLGIIVDVSHVHASTLEDAARASRKPLFASHSCASALCPLARNLTDDQIKRIAGTGGLVAVNFYPGFLDPHYFARHESSVAALFDGLEKIEREYHERPVERQRLYHQKARRMREAQGPPEADLDLVCAHIEHIVAVAGPDHAGLGSDFDGIPDVPRGLPDAAAFPALLARLRERGLSAASIEKIAWGNFQRLLGAHDL